MENFLIGSREIGAGQPCYVIAEAGVNHNGCLDIAHQLVDAAVDAGADAVKFQTFKAESVISPVAVKADYQKLTTGEAESQLDMVRKLELPFAAFEELERHCRRRGIDFLSTAFDEESADFLNRLGQPAFKIPSGEITNLPFLRQIASYRRPLIVSTGMANLGEIETALDSMAAAGATEWALLQCTSNYPAAPETVNLRAMATLRTAFDCPCGYSDHTEGLEISLAAVALGATILEKHFTLDRGMVGPDHSMSLTPSELRDLVKGVRVVEMALGNGRKRPVSAEAGVAQVARRSLVALCPIAAGTEITSSMLGARRPGTGLNPDLASRIVGMRASEDIPAGILLTWSMLQ